MSRDVILTAMDRVIIQHVQNGADNVEMVASRLSAPVKDVVPRISRLVNLDVLARCQDGRLLVSDVDQCCPTIRPADRCHEKQLLGGCEGCRTCTRCLPGHKETGEA